MDFAAVDGPITIFPDLNTEYTLATINTDTAEGDNIKIDYVYNLLYDTTSDWSIAVESRIYNGDTLIAARPYSSGGSAASAQIIPLPGTYIDTAVTTGITSYTLRVIVTAATNVTGASGNDIDMNIIIFP